MSTAIDLQGTTVLATNRLKTTGEEYALHQAGYAGVLGVGHNGRLVAKGYKGTKYDRVTGNLEFQRPSKKTCCP